MPRLLNSSHDMLGLVGELNARRIPRVYGTAHQRSGHIRLSDNEVELLKTARRLHARYSRGDYRHSEYEVGQLAELMNILINRHADNHGGIVRPIDFNIDDMESPARLPKGSYEEVTRIVLEKMA